MPKHAFVALMVLLTTTSAGCLDIDDVDVHREDLEAWGRAWEDWAEREHPHHGDREARGTDHEQHHGDEHDGHAHDHGHDRDHDEVQRHGHHDRDQQEVEARYRDADHRHSDHIDGHEDSKRTFPVKAGDRFLRVKLAYDLEGDIEIRLRSPAGLTVAVVQHVGEKSAEETAWFETEDPLIGDWTVHVDIDGSGSYAYGAYVR